MSHLDASALATYNSLFDPHLQCYFSNDRIRSHLKHAGIISRRGDIVSDSEYRLKLTRNEHKKHVRQVLAENIVHKAIDMERKRQAELKRKFDTVSKAALVNSVKESRRRGGYQSMNISNSNDVGILSMHSSWSQARPRSASHHRDIEIINEELGEQSRIPRVHSAHVSSDHRVKHSSKSPDRRRRRYLNRPKSTHAQRPSSFQRPRSPVKPSDSIPSCQITMVYYGPHTKVDYDHSLFEPVDEVIVMQQHCGGENLIVYKDNLKAGDQFTFTSHRHADYPFGLSIYVKGLIDSRISTCCEAKHHHGVRLGGERGHFAIVSVEGEQKCLKCRFENDVRLKQYANSPKDANETDKPIIISLPASENPKRGPTPVKIPVRPTPNSDENYSEDFDESDNPEKPKSGHSTDSNRKKIKSRESSASVPPIATRVKSPTETSSESTARSEVQPSTKTWQITFHTSNIPTGSFQLPKATSMDAFLKLSYIAVNGKDETEQYEIEMKDFPQFFKSGRQDSFRAKLRNIGQPKQIRLLLEVTGKTNEELKWHLDHIELIDPQTQLHYKFPCNQWIYPSEERILNLSDSSQSESVRKSSTSSKSSSSSSIRRKRTSQPTTTDQKPKPSRSSSSSSSYESPPTSNLIEKPVVTETRRISTDVESDTTKNKTHYRVVIYSSKDDDGEFSSLKDSRIFIRLNDQTKHSYIYKKNTKDCPTFEAGENQTFEIDLVQNTDEQPSKLTIGYYNSHIAAGKWKLQKVVLTNTNTNKETVFLCNESLVRNDLSLRAEKTFYAQSKQSDDDDDQSTPRIVNAVERSRSRSESEDNIPQQQVQVKPNNRKQSSSPESLQQKPINKKNDEKPPSVRSSERSIDNEDTTIVKNKDSNNKPDDDKENKDTSNKPDDDDDEDDEENEYNNIFKRKDTSNKNEVNASSSRPKTRRGREDSLDKVNEQVLQSNKPPADDDIWRPSSALDRQEPVDPLIGLDDLQDQTARSNEQKNQSTFPSSTTDQSETHFKNWYSKNDDDDDD